MRTHHRQPVGRPRTFDPERALDRALLVFWRQGYEGTSLADLTEAMGINRTSLYAAFGNKRALFDKALTRYAETDMAYTRHALTAPTARQVTETFLRANAQAVTSPGRPPGCFSIQGGLACGPANADVSAALARSRAMGESALRERFEQSIHDGDLRADTNPAHLARYIMTVAEGMAVHAAAGATRPELDQVVTIALRAFPVTSRSDFPVAAEYLDSSPHRGVAASATNRTDIFRSQPDDHAKGQANG